MGRIVRPARSTPSGSLKCGICRPGGGAHWWFWKSWRECKVWKGFGVEGPGGKEWDGEGRSRPNGRTCVRHIPSGTALGGGRILSHDPCEPIVPDPARKNSSPGLSIVPSRGVGLDVSHTGNPYPLLCLLQAHRSPPVGGGSDALLTAVTCSLAPSAPLASQGSPLWHSGPLPWECIAFLRPIASHS